MNKKDSSSVSLRLPPSPTGEGFFYTQKVVGRGLAPAEKHLYEIKKGRPMVAPYDVDVA